MRKLSLIATKIIMTAIFVMLLLNVSCNDPVEVDNTSPNASFSVDPLVGNTETIFKFDANESVDYDDDKDDLEIRWDWEDDENWDTDFSQNKAALHLFPEEGVYTIRMEIKDPKNAMSQTTKTVTVYQGNSPPTSWFTVDPEVGYIDTTFTFDASDCSDIEDPKDSIRVRWDFEGDGSWDTPYSKQKITTHRYEDPGTYSVTLEAMDTKGLVSQRHLSVEVTFSNTGPLTPTLPSPATGSTDKPTYLLLKWTASDPEGDPITFDVYFGTEQNPPLLVSGIDEMEVDPGFLDYETVYYWKVVAKDNHGLEAVSPLWTFTTFEVTNYQDSFVDARDGKTYKTISIGDQVEEGWVVKAQLKPFVRLIWLGALIMALGGFLNAESGYANGYGVKPNYRSITQLKNKYNENNFAEVVKVTFNNNAISLEKILKHFLENHDPTQLNRQGNDIGTQYRSTILFSNDVQKNLAKKLINQYQELLIANGYGRGGI